MICPSKDSKHQHSRLKRTKWEIIFSVNKNHTVRIFRERFNAQIKIQKGVI